jgi:hypothetical protein
MSESRAWAANPDNACAANGVTSDGKPYHYSAAHNGYVYDEPASTGTGDTVTTETTGTQDNARAFYRRDYRKMARLIQSMRHVKGDPYTAKPDQSGIDNIAVYAAGIFGIDADEHPGGPSFSAEKFLAGTQLPVKPDYSDSPDDEEGIFEVE